VSDRLVYCKSVLVVGGSQEFWEPLAVSEKSHFSRTDFYKSSQTAEYHAIFAAVKNEFWLVCQN